MYNIRLDFRFGLFLGLLFFITYSIPNSGNQKGPIIREEPNISQSADEKIANQNTILYSEATVYTCEAAKAMLYDGVTPQGKAWTTLVDICAQATDIARITALGKAHGTIDEKAFANLALAPQQITLNCKKALAHLINSNIDGALLTQAKKSYKEFSPISYPLKTAVTASMLLSFITYPADKNLHYLIQSAMEGFNRLSKSEFVNINCLPETEQNTAIIKGVAVPLDWAPFIHKLIADHTVTTADDVTYWLRFLAAPFSSCMINAITDIMEQFNDSRFKRYEKLTKEQMQALRAVATTEGNGVGKIDYFPATISDELAKELFEKWKKSREQAIKSNEQ